MPRITPAELELAKRELYRRGLAEHPSQHDFVRDKSRFFAAVAGRRAGKTEGVARKLLAASRRSNNGVNMSVYVGLRKDSARQVIWERGLKRLSERYDLGLRLSEQDQQMRVVCPWGHKIWLTGCPNRAEIEKFRGFAYAMAVVDECGSMPWLEELVRRAIRPALADAQGSLGLVGTPGLVCAGYWHDVTGCIVDGCSNHVINRQWSVRHWDIFDNPFIPDPETEVHIELENYGGDANHPDFVREWRGYWVKDETALVYPYDPSKNRFEELPGDDSDEWHYGLGVDIGYNDACALVVGCYRVGHPEIYLVHAEKHERLIVSAVAGHVDRLCNKYPISRVVVDTGGSGAKTIAEELRQRYGMPCEAAQKKYKRDWQQIMAGDLRSGRIKVRERRPGEPVQGEHAGCLIDEWLVLGWDPSRTKEDERFPNHASDAALYLCRAFKPQHTAERQVRDTMSAEKRAALEQLRQQHGRPYWMRG